MISYKIGYKSPLDMAEKVVELVLAQPGLSRSAIVDGLKSMVERQGRMWGDPTDNTVYRWINRAIELDLLVREGTTSAARYFATETARMSWLRGQVSRPVTQRAKVGYRDEFLDSYKPNKTFYLGAANRARLANRCPIGSAPISQLGDHDVSIFLSDLAFWSSNLEGNEYDYASTVQLIEHRIDKVGASKEDRVMILNHHDAVRHIINFTPAPGASDYELQQSIGVRTSDMLALHAILSQDLMKDPRHCGALRRSHVEIRESSYIPPDVPARIAGTFGEIMRKAAKIKNPWEQSLFMIVHMPYLQPFEDCNKRTSRVACNIPLLRAGVTPMSWTDVSHRAYIDGMLAVYEYNDPLLIAEVFTEGYLRSSERFALMRREGRPDQIACDYRNELRQVVRAMILEDRDIVPPNVPQEQVPRFLEYAGTQLSALRENPHGAARFGLSPADVEAFEERSQPLHGASDTAIVRERVRG